jgi:hypothetical protein
MVALALLEIQIQVLVAVETLVLEQVEQVVQE